MQTKLRPPVGRSPLIARPRLARGLGAERPPRMIVVRAPAGYGKTTLLAQWCDELDRAGRATGWVTLDEDDNEPSRLLLHLAAALLGADPERAARLEALVAELQAAPASASRILDHVTQIGGARTLFLDELEHLVDERAIAIVRRLIDRLPEGATVVVASRAEVPLGLGRLNLSGDAAIIGADDLRFGADETAAFLSSRGARLSAAGIADLLGRTEGWAAALQLVALATAGREDAGDVVRQLGGSSAEIADYLGENVLDRLPADTVRFLLDTSILRRLSAELCDAVTGRRSSRRVLERLASAGYFLTELDRERRWFRYHPLFAKLLQSRLVRRSPRRVAALHRAAARWHARRGVALEAVHHALAAPDFALAASLMNDHAKEMNRQGQFATVLRWSRELPKRELDAHPAIRAAAAWAHLFHREFDEAERELAEISRVRRRRPLDRRVEDDVRIVAPIMAGHQDRIAETLELSRSSLARLSGADPFNRGALLDSLAYALIAAGRFEDARSALLAARIDHVRSGSLLGSVYTATIEGSLEAAQGDLSGAEALYREADRLAGAGSTGPGAPVSAIVVGYLAELLYERNELDEAERRIDAQLPIAAESAVVDMVVCAYLASARIRFARGAPDDARAVLREAEVTGLRRDWPRLVAAARWEGVRFALREGAVAEARVLRARITDDLLAAEERPLRPHAGETEAQEIGDFRLSLRGGRARRVLPAIRAERRAAEAERRRWRTLRLRVLEAEAEDALGDRAGALRTLGEGLRRAAPQRFVRSVADEGTPAIVLVQALRADCGDDESFRSYLDEILAAAGAPLERPSSGVGPPLEPLSRREHEILALLAEGLPNRALARRLFVSENTVQFHLKAIYGKLGASNRAEAVARARRAGLIC